MSRWWILALAGWCDSPCRRRNAVVLRASGAGRGHTLGAGHAQSRESGFGSLHGMAAGWYVPAALGRVDLGDDADRTEHRRCRSGGYGARLPSGDTTLKECLAVGHRCGASAVSAHVGRGSALDRVPSLADRNIVGKGQHARREVRAVDAFHRCGSPGFVAGKNDFERALSREVLCSQKVREAGWGFDGRSLIPLELVLRRASSRVGHGPTFVDAIASE